MVLNTMSSFRKNYEPIIVPRGLLHGQIEAETDPSSCDIFSQVQGSNLSPPKQTHNPVTPPLLITLATSKAFQEIVTTALFSGKRVN